MTEAMIASGETVAFGDLGRPSVDKHSTGGVADGVTLVFAPARRRARPRRREALRPRPRSHGRDARQARGDPRVPDRTRRRSRSPNRCERSGARSPRSRRPWSRPTARSTRCGTRPPPSQSIPLIAASVMSKKLAVATDLILLDVKAGLRGVHARPARRRARWRSACLALARGAERPAAAAVTDMSQPLGDAVGNALDIVETVAILRGEERGRLRELAVWFAARAVERLDGGPFEDARARAEAALDDGIGARALPADGARRRAATLGSSTTPPGSCHARPSSCRSWPTAPGSSRRSPPTGSGSRAAPSGPAASTRVTRSIPPSVS